MNTENYTKIKEALNPSFNALKQACKEQLERQANAVRKNLEEVNWDMDKAYPYPAYNDYSNYKQMMAEREAAYKWVEADKDHPDYSCAKKRNDPTPVKVRPNQEERIERMAIEYANNFLESYAQKLVVKVAGKDKEFEISEASYNGTLDPFDASQLTVKGERGEMVWNTKCIVNVSKYMKLFNQWPTRLASHTH
jgi:hypothetical protein